jgi:hypothetical protein
MERVVKPRELRRLRPTTRNEISETKNVGRDTNRFRSTTAFDLDVDLDGLEDRVPGFCLL